MKYVTLEEANTYFSIRIDANAWDQANATKKEKYLNHVERIMERLSFKGLQDTADMIFPRNGVETRVPFLEAIYDEALSVMNGNKIEQDLTDLPVKSSSVAGIQTITVNELMERPWTTCGLTSPVAWQLLAPLLIDLRTFNLVAG